MDELGGKEQDVAFFVTAPDAESMGLQCERCKTASAAATAAHTQHSSQYTAALSSSSSSLYKIQQQAAYTKHSS